jgi:hypothetical protein
MFVLSCVIALIIGYLLKGRLRNLEYVEVKSLYLVIVGFSIEVIIIILIRTGVLSHGWITLTLDAIMYILLFIFIYLNRKDIYLLIMGVGFILNAIPIFANGGAMPVSEAAAKAIGAEHIDVTKQGLYVLINSETRFWYLGDIIPIVFITRTAASIGDFILAIGLILFIITGMKKSKPREQQAVEA